MEDEKETIYRLSFNGSIIHRNNYEVDREIGRILDYNQNVTFKIWRETQDELVTIYMSEEKP